jgi:hypothetical protein
MRRSNSERAAAVRQNASMLYKDVDSIPASGSDSAAPIKLEQFAASTRRAARIPAFHVVCLALVPVLQLALNRNLFINPPGDYIDPWLYTGCFISFPEHMQLFASTYYVNRLSWLLPGILAHNLFPALAANYVLHLGFFYALLFGTYALLSSGANRQIALLGAIVMGWTPAIVSALSWDYVDGAGIVFIVLTLLCLEKSATTVSRRWLWSTAAGAGMACMATSNLFLVVMTPIVLLFYVMRAGPSQWRAIAATAVTAGAGGVMMLGAFALANHHYGGPWFFMAPSFAAARYVSSNPDIWRVTGWHARASWLALPFVAAAGTLIDLVSSPRGRTRFSRALQVTMLAAAALWTGFEMREPLLQISYYSSYLLPLSVLALMAQVDLSNAGFQRSNIFLAIATMVAFVCGHWFFLDREPGLASTLTQFPWAVRSYQWLWFGTFSLESFSTFVAVGGGVLAVMCLKLIPSKRVAWCGFVIGMAIGCAAAPSTWPSRSATHVQQAYAEAVAVNRYVTAYVKGRSPRFWYDVRAFPNRSLQSIASTYFWGFSLVNEQFPRITAAEARLLPANTRFVLLIPATDDVAKASQSLLPHGLGLAVVDRREFPGLDGTLSVVLADLVRLQASR